VCGILGSVGKINIKRFSNSLKLIKHRGPDKTNFLVRENIFFGHQRLKIIDLNQRSDQPMYSKNKNFLLTYNGEIFNYLDLKKKLIDEGVIFETTSDTEVLLKSYELWGKDCIEKFEGMFAFAIYDFKKKELIIARDRSGIKPLYYSFTGGKFIFSSEVDPIVNLLDKVNLNPKSINSFLNFRYVLNNKTFLNEINELPPGKILLFKDKKIKIKSFWSLKIKNNQSKSEDEISYELNAKIKKSVKNHLISDVPVASFLSGGLDSSIITYEASNLSKYKINSFVIKLESGDRSDSSYAKLLANKFKTNHNEIYISKKMYFDKLNQILDNSSYPSGVPNEIAINIASNIIKQKNSVILTGEGADELFGGYGRIFSSYHDYRLLKKNNLNQKLKNKIYKKYSNFKFKNRIDHFYYLYDYTKGYSEKILNKKYSFNFKSYFNRYFDKFKNYDDQTQIQSIFYKIHLPCLLKRIDLNTMSSGLEARVPFLDNEIIDYIFQVPSTLKIKKIKKYSKNLLIDEMSEKFDATKYILKKAYKNKLPSKIISRKKIGFPVPLNNWINSESFKLIRDTIENGSLMSEKIINKKEINNILMSKENLKKHSMLIWSLYSVEKFLRKTF
tara:strand:+ start:295 stop:2139 length:1845 start_codon:yes stop_codon:yes gene_type:complete